MLHLHSLLRWAVLILLLVAIFRSLNGWLNKKPFTDGDNKTGLYLMLFAHLQLVLGIILYYTQGWFDVPFGESMKVAASRFWKVEHLVTMLIAITLITFGRIRSKKATEDNRKHRISAIFYGIALLLILWAIPWEIDRLY